MVKSDSNILPEKEFNLRKRHQRLTWGFLIMSVVFIAIGLSVWANVLPPYSIVLVTVAWIGVDFIRDSVGSEINRVVAHQKAEKYK